MSRPLIITSQPRRCISRAISFPMPPEEPVTCSFDDALSLRLVHCTNTSLTSATHRHVTHQRHPPRQICTRCRVQHHRGKHCHPQCSLSSWHHHHAPGNPRSTAILFPEEPVPARSTTHCHCGSHTVHRHVTHRRSGRTSTQSVRIICKPKTSSVDCCAGQGAAFADLKQTNAGISAQTAALLSAQAAALRSVQ